MDGLFNVGKIFVVIKNKTNFKVSSIIVVQGKKLTSSYTYQVLVREKKLINIQEDDPNLYEKRARLISSLCWCHFILITNTQLGGGMFTACDWFSCAILIWTS